MNIFFSIIVPVYNVEAFLPKCLDSIIEQTYSHFEVILIDDGSTDTSGTICDNYARKDKRIIVIHKRNERQGIARKVATEHATGDYIVPVDGDDWIHPDLLNHLSNIIGQYSPDIICYGEERRIDAQQSIPFYNFTPPPGYYDRKQIIHTIFPVLIRDKRGQYIVPGVCGKAFKRALYGPYQTTVDPRLIVAEDAVVTYACVAQAQTLYFSSNSYYYYRVNPHSTLRQQKKGYPWDNPHWANQYLQKYLMTDYDFTPQLKRRICHALFNIAVSHLATANPYSEIKTDILNHLSMSKNTRAIEEASFCFPCKDWFARIALKYKLIFLIRIYSIFAKRFIRK